MNVKKELKELIKQQDTSFIQENNLDPYKLIIAFATVESGMNPTAVRYEHHWKYLFRPEWYAAINGITPTTEEVLQSCSWGLFQIMGSVAREYKYSKPLHLLATHETIPIQLEIFLNHLRKFYNYYNDIMLAISGYNAGYNLKSTTVYYKKIMDAYNKLRNKK